MPFGYVLGSVTNVAGGGEYALALAIGRPLLITLVFLPLSARRCRRLGG
ncbi:hypothetical protein [Microbispora bryophytorum]